MNNMDHEALNVEPQNGSTNGKTLTLAGAWLVRHRRIPHTIADIIAELAGLSEARHG